MTTRERLARLDEIADRHEWFFAHIDRALTTVA
jgi:hypothetical protein